MKPMAVNEGHLDRAVRMAMGIAMMALGLSGTVTGVVGLTLVLLGAAALVTGTMGRCPLYALFGWNTDHTKA